MSGLSGSAKWAHGVLASNGRIYGIPHGSGSVLIIDPATNRTDTTALAGLGSGSFKWHGGVLAGNGQICGIPYSAGSVLVINP
jgi:hypothetical protein